MKGVRNRKTICAALPGVGCHGPRRKTFPVPWLLTQGTGDKGQAESPESATLQDQILGPGQTGRGAQQFPAIMVPS